MTKQKIGNKIENKIGEGTSIKTLTGKEKDKEKCLPPLSTIKEMITDGETIIINYNRPSDDRQI